jgi:hypothetical protein
MLDINVNIFPVIISNSLKLFEDERKKYPSLKGLREHFLCSFYADREKVYAYGKNASEVTKIGFKAVTKNPAEVPKTACRMILEGFCNKLCSIGYSIERKKFIAQAFDVKNPIPSSLEELYLLKGCELRTVYLKDMLTNRLVFGIILDLKFKIEYKGKACSYKHIRSIISLRHSEPIAKEIVREIRVKTGDLTPSGKMNALASKFRLENILSIIEQVGNKIELPDGNEAIVSLQPTPIVIEV